VSPPAPGGVLGDRYRLEGRLAAGGMGEVWAARDTVLERPVAVKTLREQYAEDPRFRSRFLAEARHAALLSHPGIAGVFDFGEADGTPYIVMELVDGETLAALLARRGALPVGQAMSIVGQAGLALQAAHDAGVVHRDVKPANIIVRPDGVVKVTDFGIARALAGASVTMTGNVLGTVHYLAPEQARGERVTPASDTYALGVVAWECLEGRRPFAYDSPLAIATAHASEELPPLGPQVPPAVRDLIASATAKEPSDRPATAGEFGRRALALAGGLDDGAVAGRPPVDAAQTVAMPVVPDAAPERTRVLPALPVRAPAPVPADPAGRVHAGPLRGGRWRLLLVLVLALAIVAVALLAGNKPGQRSPGSPTTSPRSTRTAISLAAASYTGRPYADVARDLRQLGLVPDRRPQSNAARADTVLSVGTGPFQPGDTVPVTVSAGPASATPSVSSGNPGESGPVKGAGKGAGHDKKGKD
jgi:hypothetical protein